MAAVALSALLGFGREVINAHYYGTTSEMDAFLNASVMPTVLAEVFSAALVTALVPTFSEYVSLNRDDELGRLGSTVINALFLMMTGLAALCWLLAPVLVPAVAHGFPAAEQALVVKIVRWLLPGIVATSLSGACSALLNAKHRFLASALVWAVANLVTICIVVTLHRELGIFALVLGTLLGFFAQLLVQLPAILRYRLYRFELDLRHPGLAKTWALLLPVALGSGVGQINIAFDRYFASTLSAGSTAELNYTTKLAFLPIIIFAGSIGTVIFPLIAGQFAISNRDGIRSTTLLALRMVNFIVIPSAIGLMVLAYPIVQTLFERGAFGPAATSLCAKLVPFACLTLIATSYNSVLLKACYACKQVRLAVTGSSLAVATNIILSATWLPSLGARGLLLANGVASFFLSALLIALLGRLLGGFEWKPLLTSLLRISLSSFTMGAVVYIFSLQYDPAATFAPRAWHLTALLVIGLTLFLITARALKVGELKVAVAALTQKFTSGTIKKSESADYGRPADGG